MSGEWAKWKSTSKHQSRKSFFLLYNNPFILWSRSSLCQSPHPAFPHLDSTIHIAPVTGPSLPPYQLKQVANPLSPPQRRAALFGMLYHTLVDLLLNWLFGHCWIIIIIVITTIVVDVIPWHAAVVKRDLWDCALFPWCHTIVFKLDWDERVCKS